MRRSLHSAALAGMFVLLVGGGGVGAEEKAKEPSAEEKAWLELSTPGPEHAELKKMVGVWKATTTSFAPEVSTSEGKATMEILFGGRYVRQKFEGEMHGQPFQGEGIWGYDKGAKKYTGMWCDSMITGMMHTEGTRDAKTGILTEFATIHSPAGPCKTRMTTEWQGENQFTFTMYMASPDGKEMKSFQIVYTRAK